MALIFTETDTNGDCAEAAFCSGGSVTTGTNKKATVGGAAGSAENSFSLTSSQTNVTMCFFECIVDTGVSWDAGTWTVRFNVTSANMNLTVTDVYICRVNSSCTNQATIGSATGLSISLGATGVKTQTVTGASQTPGAGDKVMVVLLGSNGAMSLQTAGITPNQNIDSPFSVAPVATSPVDDEMNQGGIAAFIESW